MTRREAKERLNGHVPVPTWAMVVTYVLCWTFSVLIIASQLTGLAAYRPLMIALAVYLLFWPVLQVAPDKLIARLFGSG